MSTMTKQITLVEKKWLGKSLFSLLCYGESQPRSRLFWGISRQEKAHFQKQIKFFFQHLRFLISAVLCPKLSDLESKSKNIPSFLHGQIEIFSMEPNICLIN